MNRSKVYPVVQNAVSLAIAERDRDAGKHIPRPMTPRIASDWLQDHPNGTPGYPRSGLLSLAMFHEAYSAHN